MPKADYFLGSRPQLCMASLLHYEMVKENVFPIEDNKITHNAK